MKEKIKTIWIFIFIISIIFLGGCQLRIKDTWQGSHYPTEECSGSFELGKLESHCEKYSPNFESLEDCKLWGLRRMNDLGGHGFECGKNCRLDKDYRIDICEEVPYGYFPN